VSALKKVPSPLLSRNTLGTLPKALVWLVGVSGAGWAASWLGVPVPWFLGPLLVSLPLQEWLPISPTIPRKCARVGQVLVALVVGAAFTLSGLSAGAEHALPLTLLLLTTMGLSLGNATLLRRLGGIDGTSALLGSLPGGAGPTMALISDRKVDRQMVAMLMYTRMLMITILMPLILAYGFVPAEGVPLHEPATGVDVGWASSALLPGLVVGLAGGWIAARLGLPSAWFLGPFLATAVCHAAAPALFPGFPRIFVSAGLLLLAVSIGAQFELGRIRLLWRPAMIQAVLAVFLIAGCLVAGVIFHRFTGVDIVTAVLGSAPGGKEAMIALGMAMGANIELLVVMQTVRWLAITILVPVILRRAKICSDA